MQTLDEYYARIAREKLSPLWERLADLVPPEPRIEALAYRWEYAAVKPFILESSRLIEEEEAERRVLILENPGLVGQSAVTNTLFARLPDRTATPSPRSGSSSKARMPSHPSMASGSICHRVI